MASDRLPSAEFAPGDDPPPRHVLQPWCLRQWLLLLMLFFAGLGDFANFYITVSLVANAYPVVTLLVVLALTSAALALAHVVGVQLREHRASRAPHAKSSGIVLACCWGLLGLSAAAVRWVAPFDTGGADDLAQFGAAAVPADSSAAVHAVTSLLLFSLYVASGSLAAWIAYLGHDPVHALLRTRWRRVCWTGFWHRRRRVRLVAAETVLAQHCAERDRVAANYAAARGDRTALAAELKHYARNLIAARLGDPVASDALAARVRTTATTSPAAAEVSA